MTDPLRELAAGAPEPDLAVRAATEQLEAMRLDGEPGRGGDAPQDRLEAELPDLDRPATGGADDVVVVRRRLAGHVGVLAGRQVDPLDQPEIGQQVEGAEDRRAAHLSPAHP